MNVSGRWANPMRKGNEDMRTVLKGTLLLLLVSLAAVMLIYPVVALAQDVDGSTDPATADPAAADPGAQEPAAAEPAAEVPAADEPAAAPPAAPTIQSDKADYPPGALVTLTGSGWQPGETVNIVVDDDQTKTWVGNF